MIIPAELSGRVCKTRISGLTSSFRKLDEIRKEWQGSEIDVVYENGKSVVVVIFGSSEDCLAFTLKYGSEYV